jgi:3,4-dihydroxy 2-butanone 4-phosphate synthase/GTP cyclohydrolase II
MNEDGRMARLNDLFKFSKKHKIKLASIEDLISYRLKYEKLINRISSKSFAVKKIGKINLYNYKNKLEKNINFVITKGKLSQKKSVPVRVISNTINNKNILNNKGVKKSLKMMTRFKNFLLLIINNKNNINKDNNINTLRYYGIGAQIIKDLNVKNMILISRSRKKIIGLEGFGLKIKKQIIIK